MVSNVTAAIIAGSFGLSGVILSQIIEWLKKRSEEKRWYSDYFLQHKIDSLTELYAAFNEAQYKLNFYGNNMPLSKKTFEEEVKPVVERYNKALMKAKIYLNEDGDSEEVLSRALGAFRQFKMAMWINLKNNNINLNSYPSQTRNLDWEEFTESVDGVIDKMDDLLNPDSLKSFE